MAGDDGDREEIGRYRLERLIGRGASGEVWEAVDRRNMRRVAVKRLHHDLVANERDQRRFLREARSTARLSDPHVVPIHNYGSEDGQWIIEMRLVEGRDLRALLADEGPLPPDRAVRIVGQVASALTAAHRENIIHRDVKPSNILVGTASDGSDFAYLADFGVARDVASESGALSTDQIVGTLRYMAPEQFEQASGPRSDIYSLACVLVECLTGQPPYPYDNLHALLHAHFNAAPPRVSERMPGLGTAFDEVVRRGLAKDPDDRQRTAVEFAALATAAASRPRPEPARASVRGLAAPRREAPAAGDTVSFGRRARFIGIALATAVILLVGATIVAVTLGSRSSDARPEARLDPTAPAAPVSTALPREIASLALPGRPETVAVSPDGRFVYTTTADGDPGALDTIDTATNTVVASTPIPGLPRFVAVNPTTGNVYVSFNNDAENKLQVAGIEATSHRIVKTIDTGQPADRKFGQTWLFVFAISRDGTRIYVPHHTRAVVSVLDTVGNVPIAQIPMPMNPHSVSLTPDGSTALVSTHASGEVDMIDTATDTFRRAIPIGAGTSPHDVDVSPDGRTAHVANFDGGTVSVIDVASGAVTATVPVGGKPQSVVWAADGRRSYVVDNQTNRLHTIAAATNTLTGSVPVPPGASMVALSPDGTRAYVASRDSGRITTLLTAS